MKQITQLWNWFQKNEKEILNAILLGINVDEVFFELIKKLDYVSKRISFEIKASLTINDKFLIIFTGGGSRKLFPKIMAIAEQAPPLEHFTAQAFIKPVEDTTQYKNGSDEPVFYKNFEIKISDLQLALADYNIETKKLKIDLYLHDYNELKQYEDLKSIIDYIVIQVIGEIAFRKHMREINLHQMPIEPVGLLHLIELPDFIDYLYKINSGRKTRIVEKI